MVWSWFWFLSFHCGCSIFCWDAKWSWGTGNSNLEPLPVSMEYSDLQILLKFSHRYLIYGYTRPICKHTNADHNKIGFQICRVTIFVLSAEKINEWSVNLPGRNQIFDFQICCVYLSIRSLLLDCSRLNNFRHLTENLTNWLNLLRLPLKTFLS